MNLEQLADKILKTKYLPTSDDLLEVFFKNRVQERIDANVKLAEACLAVDMPEHICRAQQFISRAWLLSKYSDSYLKLFVRIHEKANDIQTIQQAYKQIGLQKALEKKTSSALHFFNLWQSTYANFKHLDKFSYDFEILESIRTLASPFQLHPQPNLNDATHSKVRIAYMAFGIGFANSIMVKIIQLFVEFADKNKFEIAVCIPDPQSTAHLSEISREQLTHLEQSGAKIFYAGESSSIDASLLSMATELEIWKPDLLVTCSALADLSHYYFASLFPNLIRVALHQGPPPQFVPPDFDYAIAWTQHPVIDCPIDCELVPLELDLPNTSNIEVPDLREFGIPPDAFIITSGGRTQKYQDRDFWRAIVEILSSDPKIYFLVVGAERESISFFDEVVPDLTKSQICFAGWRKDYLSFMKAGQVVLDTYPSGGGVVLIDIMALEIPFIAFDNDYGKVYDQTDWSPIREFVKDRSLILDRGDYSRLKSVIREIRDNPKWAKNIARANYEYIHEHHGTSLRMVQKSELIFLKLLNQLRHITPLDSARPPKHSQTLKRELNVITKESKTLGEMVIALEDTPFLSEPEVMNFKYWFSYLQGQEKNLRDWSERIAKREQRITHRELKYPDLAAYHGFKTLKNWKNRIRALLSGKFGSKN